MKASDIFKGTSLKAEDIKGHESIVTIESVDTQKFDDGPKAIIKFVGKEKALICNKTNWNAIVDITGEEDSDDWTGKKIKLVVARVDFQGKRVDAIRIDPPGSSNYEKKAKPKSQAFVNESPDPPLTDEDIPFSWMLPLVLPALTFLS